MKLPAWTKYLPKKVTICGRTYKIAYNMLDGASFGCRRCKILVGCDTTRDVAVEALIHEISEVVHCELGFRTHAGNAGNAENGDMVFVLDHQKFNQHNMLMVAALKDCGLLK